jgi:hypothetical protein
MREHKKGKWEKKKLTTAAVRRNTISHPRSSNYGDFFNRTVKILGRLGETFPQY